MNQNSFALVEKGTLAVDKLSVDLKLANDKHKELKQGGEREAPKEEVAAE